MWSCGGERYLAQDNVTENTLILVTMIPRHNALSNFSNRNQCIICNVTNYTLVFVTIRPRHKIYASGEIATRIQAHFVMLQIIHNHFILVPVTMSPTGSHQLHCITFGLLIFVVYNCFNKIESSTYFNQREQP